MSGFAPAWLELREPFDRMARSADLLHRFARWSASRSRLAIVDLGSGTGSNLRALAGALSCARSWTLVEHDPALIAAGTAALAKSGMATKAAYARLDLAHHLAKAISEGTGLVTASAFLDLVSASWLDELAALVLERRAALYLTLTYSGDLCWQPGAELDREVQLLFDAHQRTDKGFGPALGPAAARALEARLALGPGELHAGASDWRLGPGDRAIQTALLEGYARAATELAPARAAAIAGWRDERMRHIEAGRSTHRVGHVDLLWLPDRELAGR